MRTTWTVDDQPELGNVLYQGIIEQCEVMIFEWEEEFHWRVVGEAGKAKTLSRAAWEAGQAAKNFWANYEQ